MPPQRSRGRCVRCTGPSHGTLPDQKAIDADPRAQVDAFTLNATSFLSIGRGIHDAVEARRGTVYLPWFWRWISVVVRMLPERLVRF